MYHTPPESNEHRIVNHTPHRRTEHVDQPIHRTNSNGYRAKRVPIENLVRFSIYHERESRTIQGTWTSPSIGSQVRPRLCSKYNGQSNVVLYECRCADSEIGIMDVP